VFGIPAVKAAARSVNQFLDSGFPTKDQSFDSFTPASARIAGTSGSLK
jgi:hypothetical protein